MAYCMYLRKSRADVEAESRGEGETLARHKAALTELAQHLHLNVTQIYAEIVSGETISARPVMRQLLSQVEQGIWEGVLVMEVERLARGDTIDQGIVAQTFQISGTKIITPLKTYDPNNEYDEEYFEFGLFMSRREYKTINRRLQRGRLTSVKEGKYLGSRPPYGYIRKKLEREKGFTLEPHPQQAAIAALIFEWYAYGIVQDNKMRKTAGISQIVKKLNLLNIPSATGKTWSRSTVQDLLSNPVYIGKIRWNARCSKKILSAGQIVRERPRTEQAAWILADGKHPPLVHLKTWQAVQRKLAEHHTHPAPKKKTPQNPLAGLVFCGICGRRMVRRPYKNSKTADVLMCPGSCCNVSSALSVVEERILQALEAWLSGYQLTCQPSQKGIIAEKETNQLCHTLAKEINQLKEQKNQLYSLLERKIYTDTLFQERMDIVTQQITALEGQLQTVQSQTVPYDSNSNDTRSAPFILHHPLESYKKAQTPEQKNLLLKSLLHKVVYTKTNSSRWHNTPDGFELILYPKLPKHPE